MKKFLPKNFKRNHGFSLIELMVVISIIAILSIIGVVVYTGVQKNSRDARRKSDIDAISRALEVDLANNNRTLYLAPTAALFAGGNLPQDPTNTGTKVYTYTPTIAAWPAAGSATYTICAELESNTGNSNANGTPAPTGTHFCRKNQQ